MRLKRYATWTDGDTFDRTLNYLSHTARIKCFCQQLLLADFLTLRRAAAGSKKPPQPTCSNR